MKDNKQDIAQTQVEQKVEDNAAFDISSFVTHNANKKTKSQEPAMWLKLGLYSSEEVKRIVRYLKTQSPSEIASAINNVFLRLENKEIAIVSTKTK